MALGDALKGLQSDTEVTITDVTGDKLDALLIDIDACLPDDGNECRDVLTEVSERDTTTQEAKDRIQALIDSLEVQGPVEYSIEGVRDLNQSEIFEMFFERPEMRLIYSAWVGEKISTYPYLAPHQNTIELTVWKHLVEQISFGGVMSYAGDRISDYASGRFNSIQEAFTPDAESNEEAPTGIDGLTALLESVEGVSNAFENDEGEGEAVVGFIDNIKGFIDDVTKDYFHNISALDVLLVEQGYVSQDGTILKPEIQSLLSNPYAISELGKSGRFESDGTIIRLGENGVIQINTLSDEEISELQTNFLQEVGELTSKNGERVDGLRSSTQKIAQLLSRFGFDSESLGGFKNFLEGIPGVGTFLAALLGFFVSDSVISELDKIGMNDSQKDALQSFESFIQNTENTSSLPFTLREENPGSISGKETRTIRGLIGKIEDIVPGQDDVQQNNIKTLLEDPLLAEKILTGVGISEDEVVLTQVHQTIKGLFTAGNTPSQEEFFEKISDINLSPLVSEDPAQGDTGEEVPEGTELAEVLDFSEALTFPFLYDGVEVDYDATSYELKVGDKIFKITNIAGFPINDEMLQVAQPKIQLDIENIQLTYSMFGEKEITLARSTLPSLLEQLIAGDEGTLIVDQGSTDDAALMILFSKSN